MPRYVVPVWKMIEEAAKSLPEEFAPIDVIRKVQEKYPHVNSKTIRCQVIASAPNHPSSKYYPTSHKLLHYLGNGKFQLLKKGEENTTVAPEISDEEEESRLFSFEFEKDLKGHLVNNLNSRENGLSLYNDVRGNGVEYPADMGRIDILATDSNGDFVVIEIKAGVATERVCGQLQKYMGWVQRHLASGKKVRGIVIAREIGESLKYAVSVLNDIKIKEYEVHFSFHDVSL